MLSGKAFSGMTVAGLAISRIQGLILSTESISKELRRFFCRSDINHRKGKGK